MQDQVSRLWDAYLEDKSIESRNALMVHYRKLVDYVAQRLALKLPSNVELDDLKSYGLFGLMDAISKFDPGRGFKFETYAVTRIQGSMLDEIRALDWVPRGIRAKAKVIDNIVQDSHFNGMPITLDELTEKSGFTMEQVLDTFVSVERSVMSPLDASVNSHEDGLTLADIISDATDDPSINISLDDLRLNMSKAIKGLPDREKTVVTLYYYEGLTLAQIGVILGVTESRICQIHTKACKSLLEVPRYHMEDYRCLLGQ